MHEAFTPEEEENSGQLRDKLDRAIEREEKEDRLQEIQACYDAYIRGGPFDLEDVTSDIGFLLNIIDEQRKGWRR